MKPTYDMVAFFAFISFFPQLVAGPIERATNLLPQFLKVRTFDYGQAVDGMQQILYGLFKKMVIADNCSRLVDIVFSNYQQLGSIQLFLGAVFFTFQIYCDFSGYSDMAIGIARILGIHLPDNFNIPYLAFNVTEFWKRWHMSLSSWLRDYLYIPLGGNRKGALRTYFNLIATMLLGGLWHGAAWTYVIWGGLHGIALAFNKIWSLKVSPLNNTFTKIVSVVVTFHFVTLCWIFFRAESFSKALLISGS